MRQGFAQGLLRTCRGAGQVTPTSSGSALETCSPSPRSSRDMARNPVTSTAGPHAPHRDSAATWGRKGTLDREPFNFLPPFITLTILRTLRVSAKGAGHVQPALDTNCGGALGCTSSCVSVQVLNIGGGRETSHLTAQQKACHGSRETTGLDSDRGEANQRWNRV